MYKRILMLSALAASLAGAQAKVRLPHIIGDNMVIQQASDVRLWGTATPGATVGVAVSWSDDGYKAKADAQGKWQLTVKSPKADGRRLSMSFGDGDGAVTVRNVLAGEVWVCAGQSNMEMPIKGFDNCPVDGYNDVVAGARADSLIHFVKIPGVMSMTPLDDADCEWKQCCPATVGDASAAGYFFAKTITRATGVPVGLIMANKGGSRVESWLTRENLEKYTSEPLDSAEMVKKFKWDFHRPMLWANGTFNPILRCTVKGILYYQGCSNVGDPGNQYSDRVALLAKQWRQAFGLGDIPFYIVEIAPYKSGNADGTWSAKLREQQLRASRIIPNSGFVSTNDCVYPWEMNQIHPAQKRPVGERLAWQALNKTYGMRTIWCESPSFKSLTISNDTCYVKLDNTYGGMNRMEGIEGFEVAGADKVFHKAAATYDGAKGVTLTCPEVKAPVAVRYRFKNFSPGNFANMAGLPLIPFRTDKWDE